MRRVVVAAVAALGLGATAVGSVAAALPTGEADAPRTATTAELLAELSVAPPSDARYERAGFEHWIDADGDGCDTRHEVLIAESVTPVGVGAGCALTGGRWVSPYDGATTRAPAGLDVDHVVPLAEAWRSGAWAWSDDRRRAFANDLEVPSALVAVTRRANRAKADRDPATWLPPDAGYSCRYLGDWVRVKHRWRLAVDQLEHDAIERGLASCEQEGLPVPAHYS